mmetsp:Transcript_3823/g.8951  ORF Transcript_3823/g.8951 Transcript_3823/m.8951 type:complete len:206 (+) Transcript_3823:222-839(+)
MTPGEQSRRRGRQLHNANGVWTAKFNRLWQERIREDGLSIQDGQARAVSSKIESPNHQLSTRTPTATRPDGAPTDVMRERRVRVARRWMVPIFMKSSEIHQFSSSGSGSTSSHSEEESSRCGLATRATVLALATTTAAPPPASGLADSDVAPSASDVGSPSPLSFAFAPTSKSASASTAMAPAAWGTSPASLFTCPYVGVSPFSS